jgi:hypothetical protein
MAKSTAIVQPNLGLYFTQPGLATPVRALVDGNNFRIKYGRIDTSSLGWNKFSEDWTLDGRVMLIDNYVPRAADPELLFADPTDIYLYDATGDTVVYLTPRYEAGTAAASGTAVTGMSTAWDTNDNVLAGDQISFGAAGENDPAA